MATFGVEVEENNKAKSFFKSVKLKFSGGNILTNPFTANIKVIKNLCVVQIEPIYLCFPKYVSIILIFLFLAFGWSKWLIPFLVISLLGVFWSKHFFFIMFRMGLRKSGYKGKIALVSNKEIIKRVLFNGTRRSKELLE